MYFLLAVTNKQNNVSTTKNKTARETNVRMCIETAFS
jgi:hypothetical protein